MVVFGKKGYKEAAELANSNRLSIMFGNLAQQRYEFGHEIKSKIKLLGGLPEKGDTIAAKVHRFWMDLRTLISSNTDEVVIEEVARGEENALKYYLDAARKLKIDSSTYEMVERHRNRIQQSLNHMRELEEVMA
ncbi:MAG: PA2169 family four-helix-bundle protein [Bacteroidota bacterium]